jgi:hypothetical protein
VNTKLSDGKIAAAHSIISLSRASTVGSMVGPTSGVVVDDEFELKDPNVRRVAACGMISLVPKQEADLRRLTRTVLGIRLEASARGLMPMQSTGRLTVNNAGRLVDIWYRRVAAGSGALLK